MFHIAAYTESQAAVTNDPVTALTDEILAVVNGNFLPQVNYSLLFAYAGGVLLDRARIVSPSNRQVTLPFIRPINVADLPATDTNIADYRDNPFVVRGLEELSVEASTSGAGPTRTTILVGLSRGTQLAPAGDIYTMRGTSTTAATANAWSTIAVTWADNLPAGDYEVVGLETFSANAIASRLIIENQIERPGSVSVTSLANRNPDMFRKGRLGSWGRFTSTRMPIVQVLANAADAAHEIYLDFVRIR